MYTIDTVKTIFIKVLALEEFPLTIVTKSVIGHKINNDFKTMVSMDEPKVPSVFIGTLMNILIDLIILFLYHIKINM